MADIEEITGEIAVLIPRILRGIQSSLAPAASVTLPQFILLAGLKDVGPTSASDLARARGVTAPTITRLVDRLLEARLVRRVEDPEDRRRVRIELTPRGEEAVRAFQDAIRERWKTALVQLPESEQEAFLRAIRRVGAVLADMERTSDEAGHGHGQGEGSPP